MEACLPISREIKILSIFLVKSQIYHHKETSVPRKNSWVNFRPKYITPSRSGLQWYFPVQNGGRVFYRVHGDIMKQVAIIGYIMIIMVGS